VKHDDRVGSEPFIAGSTPTLEPMVVQAPPRHCQAIGDPWSKRQRLEGPRDGEVVWARFSQYTDTVLHGHKTGCPTRWIGCLLSDILLLHLWRCSRPFRSRSIPGQSEADDPLVATHLSARI